MNDIQRILFLTYLTNYNISIINDASSYRSLDEFIEAWIKYNTERGNKVTNDYINNAKQLAEYHYEEMIYLGIKFLPVYNEHYPTILKKISQRPPMLYYKGQIKNMVNLAIVGSRSITQFAEEKIKIVINGMDSKTNGVVSGLAMGVDTIAHKLALSNGYYTIAILANPLSSIYPKENIGLANKILENDGALISELPIGINRGKKSFVERNRLQSGISKYVVPIEFGQNSGTMHTIDFCARQERTLLTFQPTKDEEMLPQYQGFKLLENKKSLKKIIITKEFNLQDIETLNNEPPKQPSLFD